MRRRTWMKLGLASAAALAVGGGLFAIARPATINGQLTPLGTAIFRACGNAMLDGSLPADAQGRERALAAFLVRVQGVLNGLPTHAQEELGLLLGLLASTPGRRALVGLEVDWSEASVRPVQQALDRMRHSSISLRQQAYHALHDIGTGAYFADSATWELLGYPGPVQV